MNRGNNRPEEVAKLRRRAEQIAKGKTAQSSEDLEATWPEEAR